MITVYNDAKRTTLSAWSWPSRRIADAMATNYRVNEYTSNTFNFQYLTPTNHKESLKCIVESDLKNLKSNIQEALAISIRLDGSVDRKQEHNVFVMANIVNKDGTLSSYFLVFGVPKAGGAENLNCLKKVMNDILPWKHFFFLVSSVVTDGEYNTGHLNGLCAKLKQERSDSNSSVPLFNIWCIGHRINLTWKSLCKFNIIASLIASCRNVSTYFHRSGARTLKLKQEAITNN